MFEQARGARSCLGRLRMRKVAFKYSFHMLDAPSVLIERKDAATAIRVTCDKRRQEFQDWVKTSVYGDLLGKGRVVLKRSVYRGFGGGYYHIGCVNIVGHLKRDETNHHIDPSTPYSKLPTQYHFQVMPYVWPDGKDIEMVKEKKKPSEKGDGTDGPEPSVSGTEPSVTGIMLRCPIQGGAIPSVIHVARSKNEGAAQWTRYHGCDVAFLHGNSSIQQYTSRGLPFYNANTAIDWPLTREYNHNMDMIASIVSPDFSVRIRLPIADLWRVIGDYIFSTPPLHPDYVMVFQGKPTPIESSPVL